MVFFEATDKLLKHYLNPKQTCLKTKNGEEFKVPLRFQPHSGKKILIYLLTRSRVFPQASNLGVSVSQSIDVKLDCIWLG